MDINSFFDGIGTELISIVIGLIVGAVGGSFVGYRIGVKSNNRQKQKAKDNAKQIQIGSITNIDNQLGENSNDKRNDSKSSR